MVKRQAGRQKRHEGSSRQTDRSIKMQRYKHPDTHTYRQIEKHRQTDRQTGSQAGRKAGKRKVTKLGGQGGRRAPRHTDK